MDRKRHSTASVSGRNTNKRKATEEWQWFPQCNAMAPLPFWACSKIQFDQQQQAEDGTAADRPAQPSCTDISLEQWHGDKQEVTTLSLAQWAGPGLVCRHACDADDAETEDTATSCSLECSGAGSGKGLSDSERSSGSPLQQGEDDSVTSTQPHRAASAAFSFGTLAVDTALELPWAGLAEVGAQ